MQFTNYSLQSIHLMSNFCLGRVAYCSTKILNSLHVIMQVIMKIQKLECKKGNLVVKVICYNNLLH